MFEYFRQGRQKQLIEVKYHVRLPQNMGEGATLVTSGA